MLKALKKLVKGRRTLSLEAQVAELRVAVAGLLAHGKTNEVGSVPLNDIDAVLLHAAAARVEMDRLSGLYEATLARIAVLETSLVRLEQKLSAS
ncbi:MAG: hypothetical protein ACOH12_14840 [Parvibaculaceae bacterium]